VTPAGISATNSRPSGVKPTFAPIAHHVLAKHQFLYDVVLIALEHRVPRQVRDLEDPVFVDRAIGRLGPPPRRGWPAGDWGRFAFSIPEGWLGGLMSGRPFRPFSRAISSRCSMTVWPRAETRLKSSSTRALSSSRDSESVLTGSDIPRMNPEFESLGIP
jgi:hypothetical protein